MTIEGVESSDNPLRSKRVGEFIKNGDEKISPNYIGSGYFMTLWLCHSEDNKWSNISATLNLIVPNFFCILFKIGPFWADRQTPPFVRNGPHWCTPNTWVGNFVIKRPPFNLNFVPQMVVKYRNWAKLGLLAVPLFVQNLVDISPN